MQLNRTKQLLAVNLSYQDRDRLHFFSSSKFSRRPRFSPLWANSDNKIKVVLYCLLWRYVNFFSLRHRLTPGMPFRELEQLALETQQARRAQGTTARQRRIIDAHLRSTRNGIMGTWMRLIYLAYRQRFSSPAIASELQWTPNQVRQKLHHVNQVAAGLFPKDFEGPLPTAYKQCNEGRFNAAMLLQVVRENPGKSLVELAKKLNTRSDYFGRLLRKFGIPFACNGSSLHLTEQQAQELCSQYQSGKKLSEIGQTFGCSAATVGNYLQRAGIPRRPRVRRARNSEKKPRGGQFRFNAEQAREMRSLYLSGKPLREVARHFNCCLCSVANYLHRQGVVVRKPNYRGRSGKCRE